VLRTVIIVGVTLAAAPVLAAASPWQEISPGTRARLISSDTLTEGHTMAGLEIELPAGTYTYWRIPGETGIPPQFDFSASTGIAAPQVLWPAPSVEVNSGYTDYVYRGTVVFPIELTADAGGAVLGAAVTLGVCSDMCVPARATLTLPITFGQADSAQSIRIDQAVALTPIPWDQPRQPFSEVTAGPSGSIDLHMPDPSIDPDSLIADIGDPAVIFSAPQKSPDGTLWTLRPLGSVAPRLEGLPVQLTFMTRNGPYQVTRTLNTSAPQ
jgi:DsbC/DsbD-like thiol-disulfide interchange protein